jgi:uncharacterized membrane protein
MSSAKSVERRRKGLAALLLGIGTLHFLTPRFFDELIPGWLGNPRAWTYGSGVAEITAGALVLNRRTTKVGGWAAFAVILGVWPGNWKMALDAGAPQDAASWVAWLRLPLQLPLLWWAGKVAMDADPAAPDAPSDQSDRSRSG